MPLEEGNRIITTDDFAIGCLTDVVVDASKDGFWIKAGFLRSTIIEKLRAKNPISKDEAESLWEKLFKLQEAYEDAEEGVKAEAVKRIRELLELP
jgi:hypothetical protein